MAEIVQNSSQAGTKASFKFSPGFIKAIDESLSSYDQSLDHLQSLIHGNGFDDDYGVCNTRYQLIYITPHDIASYIAYLFKAITNRLIECNPVDMEKFAVEMAKRFALDNGGETLKRDNMFATSTYVDPRTQTLMDLLVQTQNTFFDRVVYSKYEMQQRAKSMKNDYDKLNGLHLTPSIKAVVRAIPDTIKEAIAGDAMSCWDSNLIMASIETFVLFVVSLNTCTIEQMIGYAQPRSTFVRKDKKETVTQESVDINKYSPVYIVLTAGKTSIVSNTIKKITNSKWSHCSISFIASLDEMYSYAVQKTEHANRAGLRRESIHGGYIKNCDICVFGMYVPSQIASNMHNMILDKIQEKTKFDIGLLIRKAFNDNASGSKDANKKICTTFVNDLIKETGKTFSDKNAPSSQQMRDAAELKPDEVVLLYDGVVEEYDPVKVSETITKYAKRAESKPFVEYVTECSLIKTTEINVHSRIPFDCNMRNIVLQDMTPNFKDTKSAMHFMLKDNRSPIHTLLIKYSSKKRMSDHPDCVPAMELFRPYFNHHNCPDEYYNFLGMDIHTDVNWLDKIAYGNTFLDGNYRLDSVGNENRHPIVQTLATLNRMYCGCDLKTNEELADHILAIAGLIHGVIESNWCACNRDLTRDILAVLGDCFTRCVLRLYHNNSVVIVYDDNMADTMIPGYMYVEQFVMEADGDQQSQQKTSVTFGNNPNTNEKTGGLNKLASLIRAFVKWVTDTFSKIPYMFNNFAEAKIKYIESHQKLNEEIGNALGTSFTVNLTNFPKYNIQAKALMQPGRLSRELDQIINSNGEINPDDVKKKLYPFPENVMGTILNEKDLKKQSVLIQNYALFGDPTPDQKCFVNGPMDSTTWNDMVSDLSQSMKLVQELSKSMSDELKQALSKVESLRKKEESNQNKAAQNQNGASENGPTNRAELLFKIVQEISTQLDVNVINALSKRFFNGSYEMYKKIVDNYQMQTKQKQSQQPNNQQPNAQQNSGTAQPAAAGGTSPA